MRLEQAAAETLLRQYHPLIRRQAYRLRRVARAAGMTEEDLAQVGRLAVMEAATCHDRTKGSLTGWLLKCVYWQMIRAIRAAGPLVSGFPQSSPRRLTPVLLFGELPHVTQEGDDALAIEETLADPDAAARLLEVEDKVQQERLLALLPEGYRQTMRLALAGYTQNEIALMCGRSRELIRQRLLKARRIWRKAGIRPDKI